MKQKQIKNSYNSRKKVRRRYSFVYAITILLCVLIGTFCTYKIISGTSQIIALNNVLDDYQSETPITTAVQQVITTGEIPKTDRISTNLRINSANAVLMDFEKGTVLFEKNGMAKIYPASMTKIMTAIIVLEHVEDLEDKVLLNEAIFQPIYNANATVAGFLPGEKVRIIDLLYGLILPSGAECAIGLTEYVTGSEKSFIKLMNDKAQELGMSGSNFTNTTGLHDSNHYSTAMDMVILFRYALSNDIFYEIITSSRYSTQASNKHDYGITFHSTLFSRIDTLELDGVSIIGGKTGFTTEAGQCLTSLAVKDNNKYILVTSNAIGNNQTKKLHIDDAFTVYTAIKINIETNPTSFLKRKEIKEFNKNF